MSLLEGLPDVNRSPPRAIANANNRVLKEMQASQNKKRGVYKRLVHSVWLTSVLKAHKKK